MPDFNIPKTKGFDLSDAPNVKKADGRAALWTRRIERAKKALNHEDRIKTLKKNARYINGHYKNTKQQRYLNEVLPAIEDVINNVIGGDTPPIHVISVGGDRGVEDRLKSLLHQSFESPRSRVRRTAVESSFDEITTGLGIVKTCWFSQVRPQIISIPNDPEMIMDDVQGAVEENADPQSALVAESDNDAVHIQVHSENGVPLPGMEGHIREHQAHLGKLTANYPLTSRVDPFKFVYDPDAEYWEERGWEAEKSTELLSTLEDIPGIKNLKSDMFNWNQDENDPEKITVPIWKIHDRDNDAYYMIPADSIPETKPILETDWPYPGDIYQIMVHRPVPGRIHGRSTLNLLTPILIELANVNADIRRFNRRASNAKPIFPRGAMDKKAYSDIEDVNKDYAEVPPSAAAVTKNFEPTALPNEVLDYRETLLAEVRRIIGSDIMSQGGDTPHKITATEAQHRAMFRSGRFSVRQKSVGNVLSNVAHDFLRFYRKFGDEGIRVTVNRPGAGPTTETLSPNDIPENLKVQVDLKATLPEEKSQRQERALAFYKAAAPAIADKRELLLWLGRELGIENPESAIGAIEQQSPLGEVNQDLGPQGPPNMGGLAGSNPREAGGNLREEE